jgi:hypothetical protein
MLYSFIILGSDKLGKGLDNLFIYLLFAFSAFLVIRSIISIIKIELLKRKNKKIENEYETRFSEFEKEIDEFYKRRHSNEGD